MNEAPRNPPAASLLDLVDEYASDLESRGRGIRIRGRIRIGRGARLKGPLKRTTPIIVFCQNFFLQWFAYQYDVAIVSIDYDAKVESARLRLDFGHVEPDGEYPPEIVLLTLFEELCDLYPDVLAMGYGSTTPTSFAKFHRDFMIRLLDAIDRWARMHSLDDLATAVAGASAHFKIAVVAIPQ